MAIVYNPNAGKKRQVKSMIEYRLKEANIPYEFLETKKKFDTYEIGKTFNIDDYSALVACGGDGTVHEVVNGMFQRPDKKRIPVGFIPNGSGDDMCRSVTINSIDRAMDFLVKG